MTIRTQLINKFFNHHVTRSMRISKHLWVIPRDNCTSLGFKSDLGFEAIAENHPCGTLILRFPSGYREALYGQTGRAFRNLVHAFYIRNLDNTYKRKTGFILPKRSPFGTNMSFAKRLSQKYGEVNN